MSKAYTSKESQDQWELLEPLIPAAQPGGRPREVNVLEVLNAIFCPREVNVLEVLNAIFYLLTQGCTWRNLPGDFPAWQTMYTYFRNWRIDGTWVRIHNRLREWTRVAHACYPSPSEAIVDSQSVIHCSNGK